MNLFKKAFKRILIAVLSVGLVTVPASLNNEVEVVNAATPTKLYLKPNSNWTQANARFAAYFFGNGEKWIGMTDSNKDGTYEVSTPAGYPSVIFCRMNPSATANNWDNKWNQTSDLAIPTNGNNCYTVKAGTWDKGGGTWSKITEVVEPEKIEYTVTFYDIDNKPITEKVEENTSINPKFIEVDGYKLCGWYEDTAFTKKFDFSTPITKNISLYSKYEVANDFTIKFYDVNSVFKNQPYIYLFGEFGFNNAFPGVSMGNKVGKYYEFTVDASKSYSNIVFSDIVFSESDDSKNVISQSVDISLEGVKDGTIFALNSKTEADGKYNYFIYEPSKIDNTKVRIFLYNEKKWSKVNCYAWDSNDKFLNGTWPGNEMSRIGSTNYYYFDTEVGTNVIFNNGSAQTADLVVPSNGKNVYSNTNLKGTGSNDNWYSMPELDTYYQEQKIEGATDKVNVRFVSTFKGLTKDKLANYNKVGFVVGSENSKGETKYVKFETTSMYTSVEVNGSVVSASELGSTYVFTIVIKNVPTGARLCVTPFAQDKNGVDMTIGQTKTFVANAA